MSIEELDVIIDRCRKKITDEQILEIKDHIDSVYGCDCAYFGVDGLAIAAELHNAGYRKQNEMRPTPCRIGDKIYDVTGEPGERIDIDEYTISEVGLNGVFTSGGWPCYRPHRHYFAYKDEGVWWFFKREDAEAERKRRDDP